MFFFLFFVFISPFSGSGSSQLLRAPLYQPVQCPPLPLTRMNRVTRSARRVHSHVAVCPAALPSPSISSLFLTRRWLLYPHYSERRGGLYASPTPAAFSPVPPATCCPLAKGYIPCSESPIDPILPNLIPLKFAPTISSFAYHVFHYLPQNITFLPNPHFFLLFIDYFIVTFQGSTRIFRN